MSEKKPTDIPVTQKETKDVFDTIFDTYVNAIDEVVRTQAQYTQTITNIQQEYNDSVKKILESLLSISKTTMHNTWGSVKIPTIFTKGISDTADVASKITNINNKTIISVLELVRQNMRVFNDNIDSFTKLGINMVNTWSSMITPQRS